MGFSHKGASNKKRTTLVTVQLGERLWVHKEDGWGAQRRFVEIGSSTPKNRASPSKNVNMYQNLKTDEVERVMLAGRTGRFGNGQGGGGIGVS